MGVKRQGKWDRLKAKTLQARKNYNPVQLLCQLNVHLEQL
jgi:hypothetical protein